jgi:mono/diheme cytochrome c family protein
MPQPRALFRLVSLPQAAAAILALGASGAALAQNVANGMTLYNQKIQPGFGGAMFNCADCHGDAPTARVIWSGRGITEAQLAGLIGSAGGDAMSAYRAQWGATQRNDVAAYIFSLPAPSPGAPPPPPPGVPPTPAITPASPVTFATTVVGARSARLTLVMTNTSTTSAVTLATPYVMNAGGAAGDFLLMVPTGTTPACLNGMVLAAQASCAFGVEFMPSLTGGRTGNWNFSFMNSVPPRLVNFAGAGSTAPVTPPAPPPPSPGPAPAPSPAPAAEGGGASAPAILAGLGAMLFAAGRRRRRDD